MIPTSQKISRVYNTHVMPTRTKWRTPHTINYCPYSLQLTRWTLFYLLGRACPKHPRYGPSNELYLLVHSLNLFCVLFMLAIVCTYMLMPTGSLQLLLLLYRAVFPPPTNRPGNEASTRLYTLELLPGPAARASGPAWVGRLGTRLPVPHI